MGNLRSNPTLSPMLADMPEVFSTASFRASADLGSVSAASRKLRQLEAAGEVYQCGRGRWVQTVVDTPSWWPSDNHGLDGTWSPALERELQAVFGNYPRRLSYATAVEALGFPNQYPRIVASPAKVAQRAQTTGIWPLQQSAQHLTLYSKQLSEHTWISSPARALMEMTQHAKLFSFWTETVADAIASGEPMFEPGPEAELREIADRFRWRIALRRLASLGEALSNCSNTYKIGGPLEPMWSNLVSRPAKNDRWVWFNPRLTRKVVWEDPTRKLWWPYRPEGLIEEIRN